VLVTTPSCCCQSWQNAACRSRVAGFRKRGDPVRDCRCARQQNEFPITPRFGGRVRDFTGAAIIRFLPRGRTNTGQADRRLGACIDGEGDLLAPGSKAPRGAGGFRFSALGMTRSGPWRSEGTGEPSGFAERCFRVASMAGQPAIERLAPARPGKVPGRA
jgi:hypothetical protein